MASSYTPVLITEPLKDFVIAVEGKGIVLECKLNKKLEGSNITGHWYKDGNLIVSCDDTRIIRNEKWQILNIKCVSHKDHGIYIFVAKTEKTNGVYTKCLLFTRRNVYDNQTRTFQETFAPSLAAKINFKNHTIRENQGIVLKVNIEAEITQCIWYKNNCIIPPKYPRCLLHQIDSSLIKFYLDKPEKKDTGLYLFAAKTVDEVYLSRFIEIHVSNEYTNALYNNETIPHIWQGPNMVTEVYEKDDIILFFKATFDVHTNIEWTKNDEEIKLTDRITCESYANKYLCLKISNPCVTDTGKYGLVLRHTLSPVVKIRSTKVTVMECHLPETDPCIVTKCLQPTTGSIGNGVTLKCAFDIPNIKYVYVEWIVGIHRIEKSNKYFKVMSDTDEFILHIAQLSPEMAGEITCQLRQHIPPWKSRLIAKSTSSLILLPPNIFDDRSNNSLILKQYVYMTPRLQLTAQGQLHTIRSDLADVFMHFQFCNMGQNEFYFEASYDENTDEAIEVKVEKRVDSDPKTLYPDPCVWRISWDKENESLSYIIDVYKGDECQYCEVGSSSIASVDIKEPPEDKLFKFRIRTSRPKKKRRNISFTYKAEEVSLRDFIPSKGALRPYEDFEKSFITGMKIGTGRFDFINLVRRRDDELFLAKTTRIMRKWKRRRADREFDVMKGLLHPNTVSLIDGFTIKSGNGLRLLMDYPWGGMLDEQIIDRKKLGESDIIVYIRQLLSALEYLHAKKIVHLNLKREHIQCINRNSRRIQIVDFGMARFLDHSTKFPITYGTHDYVAPEMIHKGIIGTNSDMWNIGVLTYWFLTGNMPFNGHTWIERSRKITNVIYEYDDVDFYQISDNAKCFVSSLLRRQPGDRLSATQALKDIWIIKGPNYGRPKKVPVLGEGGIIFVNENINTQRQWRLMINVMLAVVRFLRNRRPVRYRGCRYSARLCLARAKARRKL